MRPHTPGFPPPSLASHLLLSHLLDALPPHWYNIVPLLLWNRLTPWVISLSPVVLNSMY